MGARPSSFKAPPELPKAPERMWSPQQQDIFNWFMEPSLGVVGPGHLVVRARAGTGKTTTIIEGVQRAPEASILVAAFNKKIALELNSRITSPNVEAKTLHGLGNTAIWRQWRGMKVVDRPTLTRADWLTQQVAGAKLPKPIQKLVSNLHTHCREMVPLDPTYERVRSIALEFDCCPDEGWGEFNLDFVVEHAQAAVQYAATNDPRYDIGIDFADMIFLPLAHGLLTPDYQLVVIDEAQDMTTAQLLMSQRSCCGRICVVGDDKQAIYGFRGADSGSLDRLKAELRATELPLTDTYRCGQRIVAQVQGLIPDIKAAAGNAEGTVDSCSYANVLVDASYGDFILSRLNAPLVSLTLKLLAKGRRAKMAGRDIGKAIRTLMWSLKVEGRSMGELAQKLDTWEKKWTTRAANFGDLAAVDRFRDQAEMIRALAQESRSVADIMQRLEYLFGDENNMERDQIILSSVHKAKGLETDRVFILRDTFYRRGQSQEEDNCFYVAQTRAKSHLTFVEPEVL